MRLPKLTLTFVFCLFLFSIGYTQTNEHLKDIYAGDAVGSSAGAFNKAPNGLLYFIAKSTGNTEGVWETNGTESGTKLVRAFGQGSTSAWNFTISSPYIHNNKIYTWNTSTRSLWTIDISSKVATNILDFTSLQPSEFPGVNVRMTSTSQGVFFANHVNLYKSNGTKNTTNKILYDAEGINFLTAAGNFLYYYSSTANGKILKRLDSNGKNKTIIGKIAEANQGLRLSVINNKLVYYRLSSNFYTTESFKIEGYPLVSFGYVERFNDPQFRDFYPNLVFLNGAYYFIAKEGTKWGLYKLTTSGTSLITSINEATTDQHFTYLTLVNNQLFFVAIDDKFTVNQKIAYTFYKSNGNTAQIIATQEGRMPLNFTFGNNKLYWSHRSSTSTTESFQSLNISNNTIEKVTDIPYNHREVNYNLFYNNRILYTRGGSYNLNGSDPYVINLNATGGNCSINAQITSFNCKNNNTTTNSNDDLFRVFFKVDGKNTGKNGWTATNSYNNQTISGNYFGGGFIDNIPIRNGNLTITIRDKDNPNCKTTLTVTPPPTCSSTNPTFDIEILNVRAVNNAPKGSSITITADIRNNGDRLIGSFPTQAFINTKPEAGGSIKSGTPYYTLNPRETRYNVTFVLNIPSYQVYQDNIPLYLVVYAGYYQIHNPSREENRENNFIAIPFTIGDTPSNACNPDNVAPTITNCPAGIQLTTTGNSAIATWTRPNVSDACGQAILTSNYDPGDSFPIGITRVTYTAKDPAGNQTTCGFNVFVAKDNTEVETSTCSNSLVKNGDFSAGKDSWSGNITTGTEGNNTFAKLCTGQSTYQVIKNLDTSKNYTLSFRAKKDTDKSVNSNVRVRFFTSTWKPIQNIDKIITNTSYQNFTISVPSGTVHVSIYLNNFLNTGCLYVDDICLSTGDGGNTGGGNLPDLNLANLNLTTATYNTGAVVPFKFDIRNTGNGNASGSFVVKSYISKNRTLDAGDVQDGMVPTGNFIAGTNVQQVGGALRIPSTLAAGDYYVILFVDANGQITESNENNNYLASTNTFKVQSSNTGGGTDGTYNCAAAAINPWQNWISKVTVNGSSKVSGKSKYSNFTNTVFSASNEIHITTEASWSYFTFAQNFAIYVDWNNDNIFQASEGTFGRLTPPAAGSNAKRTWTTRIPTPSTAKSGRVKMRIIMNRNQTQPAPCGQFQEGEVEDYLVSIASTANGRSSRNTPTTLVYPNPSTGFVQVNLSNWGDAPATITIVDGLGQVLIEKEIEQVTQNAIESIDISQLKSGRYTVWVKHPNRRSIPQSLMIFNE